jgi:hypothetical protein
MMKRRLAAYAAVAALSISPGCASLFPIVEDPIRIENMDSMGAAKLGFVKGKTAFEAAEKLMRDKKLTGISKTTLIWEKSPLIGAISADYQLEIHLFENNVYKESISLMSGSILPYCLSLKLVSSESKIHLLAMYRDPMDLVEDPELQRRSPASNPRIMVFTRKDGSFLPSDLADIGGLVKRMGGLTSPIFVGSDMDMGIMFLARDKSGAVWKNAFLVRMEKNKLEFKPISLAEAARCPCMEKYLYGATPDEAKGE